MFREVVYGVSFFVSALTGTFFVPIAVLWPLSQIIRLPTDPDISGAIGLTTIAIGTISGSAAWFTFKYGWLEKRRKNAGRLAASRSA
jgi:hypothetical protein